MSESRRGKAPPTGANAAGTVPRSAYANAYEYSYRAMEAKRTPARARGRGRPALGADAFLDLAHMDCGDGPLDEVSVALRALAPGQTLEVRAADDGVRVALVAWCKLVGHTVLARRGGRFLIRQEAARAVVL